MQYIHNYLIYKLLFKSISTFPKREQRTISDCAQSSKAALSTLNNLLTNKFSSVIQNFEKIPDPRKKAAYSIGDILGGALSMFLLKTESRNCYNNLWREDRFRANIKSNLGFDLPHADTFDSVLRKISPSSIERIINSYVSRLIASKTFSKHRLLGEFYPVAIDATGICSFDHKHCDHCLTKTSKNGKVTYFHYVLEAKLVTRQGFSISIASEFLENLEGRNYEKQDCEIKAFTRLTNKIKNAYPRLPICLLLDGIYPNQTVFDICKNKDWAFIITLKQESLKTFQRQIPNHPPPNTLSYKSKRGKYNIYDNYQYKNGLEYRGQIYSWTTCQQVKEHQDTKKQDINTFSYITNINQDSTSIAVTVAYGRLRWKIENEGFNTQKNQGYKLEHKYSRKSFIALQNYYLILQIAHLINQFAIISKPITRLLSEHSKVTIKDLWNNLKSGLKFIDLTQLE